MNNLKAPPEPHLSRELSPDSAASNDSKRKRETSSTGIIGAENMDIHVAGSTNLHESLVNARGLEYQPAAASRSQSFRENGMPVNNRAIDPGKINCSTLLSDGHDVTNTDIGVRPTKRPSFGHYEGLDPNTISYLDNAANELDDHNQTVANANGSGTLNYSRSGFDEDSATINQSQLGSLGIETGGADAGAGGTRLVETESNLFRNGAQLHNTMQSTQPGNERLHAESAAFHRAPVAATAKLSPDQEMWDRSARTVFASLEAELTRNDFSAYNTANGNDNAKKSECKPISHGNAFANLEAELMAAHFSLSTSEELDSKPRAVSNSKYHDVFANLEAEISHRNSSRGKNCELSSVKPPAVDVRDSRRNHTDPMESARSIDGSLDMKPPASASVPKNDSMQAKNIDGHPVGAAASVYGLSYEAIEQSRSVFANLEEELMRHEEEEHQRARAPIEFLTSSIGFDARRRPSLSSESALTFDGTLGRNNSYNVLNEMARVDEEPMDHFNDDSGELHDVIANIEIINEEGGMNLEPPPPPLPPQLEQAPAPDPLPLGLGSQRSRDIIASIEEDILRRQQEESTAEVNFNRMFRNQIVIGPYSANLHPTALASPGMQTPNVMLNVMMMQQYRQHVQSQTSRNNLIDQVSNMAMDSADDASLNSVASCISYDGKSTNVFSIPCQTREQSMACQMLNQAVNDLVDAPVMPILREFPMLTRFVQAEDDSGDIQLHYAVRVGNSKAIRRILRVDPSCAMIRNSQGYCPLHLAAQIGNFSAVQLLCSMVPASAEVQCEEGCVPLHEALMTGAHHPDAPQIIATLASAFPPSVKLTNDDGLLPIHIAAMSGSARGLRTILGFGLSTIFARENTEAMIPLDFAVDGLISAMVEEEEDLLQIDQFQQCIDILLMSAFYKQPVLSHEREEHLPFLPIHGVAAAQPCSRSWKQIMSMFGEQYGGAVDLSGKTPLHTLLSFELYQEDVVVEAISNLCDAHPTCITHVDNSGFIPLHTALSNKIPLHVIAHLIERNGSSVSIRVSENCPNVSLAKMLPFQMAAASGASEDCIYLLLRSAPDLI